MQKQVYLNGIKKLYNDEREFNCLSQKVDTIYEQIFNASISGKCDTLGISPARAKNLFKGNGKDNTNRTVNHARIMKALIVSLGNNSNFQPNDRLIVKLLVAMQNFSKL